jgi:hypothetical protein
VTIAISDDFLVFSTSVNQLYSSIRSSTAARQSSKATIDGARQIVQEWFRSIRTTLTLSGIEDDNLLPIDELMQELLRLAQVRSTKTSYLANLRQAKKLLSTIEVQREVAAAAQSNSTPAIEMRPSEVRIVQMLDELVPSAALSYRQGIRDLSQSDRESFRGTANEFRSVVWDVLDRLAPDDVLTSSPGFKLEKGVSKPTQKQKARHILKSRLGDSARKTPETSLQLIEEHVGSLSRAIYDRTSLSSHVATSRAETMQIRMYVETLLAELLEIHFE